MTPRIKEKRVKRQGTATQTGETKAKTTTKAERFPVTECAGRPASVGGGGVGDTTAAVGAACERGRTAGV